jgi:hypothetical protein
MSNRVLEEKMPALITYYRDLEQCLSAPKAYPVTFKFADEQITNQYILAKISNYIREHDISLFDITEWNPNVALS